MVGYELEGIEVDHCLDCLGTWLDSGELEMLAELEGVPDGAFREAVLRETASRETDHGKTERRCPRCQRRLREVVAGPPRDGVEVDRCPRRCGLWFDQGEIVTVLERFHEGEPGAVAEFFRRLYRSELGGAEGALDADPDRKDRE